MNSDALPRSSFAVKSAQAAESLVESLDLDSLCPSSRGPTFKCVNTPLVFLNLLRLRTSHVANAPSDASKLVDIFLVISHFPMLRGSHWYPFLGVGAQGSFE